ncbi:MAG TPA: serine/threonine-protein kinase [Gemmatimonadaceae bacterium]|nr:serine/threonine-protein kinase [Gemmatimonadaceae bacterium]
MPSSVSAAGSPQLARLTKRHAAGPSTLASNRLRPAYSRLSARASALDGAPYPGLVTDPLLTGRAGAFSNAIATNYRVERELGAGGMATVYLATDLKHHRQVAIKLLHPELSAVLGPERFLKEIELTAGLQHPHILPLFDSGSADGLLYYVMPFVEGESLRDRLTRETQLPVADALEYAHRRGVVHRDIKPENVLLHDGHALVADFGIALAVQEAGGQRLTQTGLSLGAPQYMAPEQATGEKTVDARADIYALGAVTYEMLAGTPPFTAPTMQAVVAKLLTEGRG